MTCKECYHYEVCKFYDDLEFVGLQIAIVLKMQPVLLNCRRKHLKL